MKPSLFFATSLIALAGTAQPFLHTKIQNHIADGCGQNASHARSLPKLVVTTYSNP